MGSIIILLILAGIIWFWLDSIKTKELASQAAAKVCISMGVQFLDQTVSLEHLKTARNAQGRLSLFRLYQFEFSTRGDKRYQGKVKVLGQQLLQIQLNKPEGLIIDDYRNNAE